MSLLDSSVLDTSELEPIAAPAAVHLGESRRSIVFKALLIFMLALAARMIFFTVQQRDYPAGWSSRVLFGEDEMDQIAVNLVQGRGFSSPFEKGSAPSAWVCPFVPFLWAFVIWCAGGPTGFAHLIIAYTGTVPSAACVVVYWLIARHMLRGRPALKRTTFLVAAIFCIWPEALYQLDYMWYFPWQELATALMVLLGLKWIDRPCLKTVLPVGMMAGILALINVTPLPIFALILLLPIIENRAHWKRIVGNAAVGATLALLLTSPWLIRNAVVLHAFVPVRASGGYQLWAGNNVNGAIRPAADTPYPANQTAELNRYRAMGEIAYCRQAYRDALAYIRTHPRETLVRSAERAYVFWLTDTFDEWGWEHGPTEWWNEGSRVIVRKLSATLAAWMLVIVALWATVSKRFAALPYKRLFAGVLFLLPLPYYFTIAQREYSEILRSWLLLLVILAFSAGFRFKTGQRDAAPAQPLDRLVHQFVNFSAVFQDSGSLLPFAREDSTSPSPSEWRVVNSSPSGTLQRFLAAQRRSCGAARCFPLEIKLPEPRRPVKLAADPERCVAPK